VNANDEQMDFQVVFASGMNGIAGLSPDKIEPNLLPLFDGNVKKLGSISSLTLFNFSIHIKFVTSEILKLPQAKVDVAKSLQLLIANVDYDDFKGKMGIGNNVPSLVIFQCQLTVRFNVKVAL